MAFKHLYILMLEMFLRRTERARRIFGVSATLLEQTVAMAANQGLCNSFLAAGLIWGWGSFFLTCVFGASIYGTVMVSPRIALVQALPAVPGLTAVRLS